MGIDRGKIENIVCVMFTVVGVIFLITGVFVCIDAFNYDNKVQTTATITRIISYRGQDNEIRYNTYVKYDVDGIEYNSKVNSYSSSFYEGKEISVYYNKSNPSEVYAKGFEFFVIMFPAFGIIFSAIGGIGLFVRYNKGKSEKNLRESGEMIIANYVGVDMNMHYSVNGRHPYNIVCEWTNLEDGKKYTFKSKNLWNNPENIIMERNIKTFNVYININNKKQYVIDIDDVV